MTHQPYIIRGWLEALEEASLNTTQRQLVELIDRQFDLHGRVTEEQEQILEQLMKEGN